MVTIIIQKKDLFLIAAIVVFIAGAGIIIGYSTTGTGGNPAIMGHSIDELNLGAMKINSSSGFVGIGRDPYTYSSQFFKPYLIVNGTIMADKFSDINGRLGQMPIFTLDPSATSSLNDLLVVDNLTVYGNLIVPGNTTLTCLCPKADGSNAACWNTENYIFKIQLPLTPTCFSNSYWRMCTPSGWKQVSPSVSLGAVNC
jgi:hypothetical protein